MPARKILFLFYGDITDSYKYLSYSKKINTPNNNLIDHHLRLIKKGVNYLKSLFKVWNIRFKR
jgi:hypothetical protein